MIQIIQGDVRRVLADLPGGSVDCCVTAPPYFGLRALKPVEDDVAALVSVFRGVRRVLRNDGMVWVILGDSYERRLASARAGKVPEGKEYPKRVAGALQKDGWCVRETCSRSKRTLPDSVTRRFIKVREYVILLSKSREVAPTPEAWETLKAAFIAARFSEFPPALVEACILASSPVDGVVLDPFGGAGTTGLVADRLRRSATLVAVDDVLAARRRITSDTPFAKVVVDVGARLTRRMSTVEGD